VTVTATATVISPPTGPTDVRNLRAAPICLVHQTTRLRSRARRGGPDRWRYWYRHDRQHRVRDLDSSKGLTANTHGRSDAGRSSGSNSVVLVRISMRPAVDGNRLDVASGIEAASRQGAAQLISYLALEGFEFRIDQFPSSGTVLVFAISAGLAGRAQKVKQARFLRRTGIVVVAHGDREIQCDVGEISPGSIDALMPSF
jgi:hypothetical protein